MSVELGGGSTGDQGIADALRENGQHVFARLYETFATPLYDYCAGMLDDVLAACDVVQDSLVAVDARIAALPDPGRLRVWLYAEARRECLRKRSEPGAAAPARGEATAPGPPPGPDDVDLALLDEGTPGAHAQHRPVVTAALAGLADRDREALNLAYRHNITGPDLAEVLGTSPYRARSLLHAAGVRFGQAAGVVFVLREGAAGCRTLLGLAGHQDRAAAPPPARLGERLARHLDKCPDCALVLGGRSFGPELLARIPLEPPVGRLALRITRTALALGSYRVKVADLPDAAELPEPPEPPEPPDEPAGPGTGRPPAHRGRRRAALKAVAASSAAIAVLGVLGGLVLPHILAGHSRPPVVKAVSGVQPSPAAGSLTSPVPDPAAPAERAGNQRKTPALPLLGPTPLGVLPTGSTSPSGTSPAPSHTSPATGKSTSPAPKRTPSPTPPQDTSPAPTTPPPTTPPPSTPPPSTPPPSPTPSSTTIG